MIQTLINMSVFANKPVLQITPKAILTQVVNLVVSRMEECNQKINILTRPSKDSSQEPSHPDAETPEEKRPYSNGSLKTDSSPPPSKTNSDFDDLVREKEYLEDDAVLVLYLLSHLSLGSDVPTRAEGESSPASDSRCRAITLELIISMLNNSGRLFQSDARFNQIVKHNLCLTVSRNGVSTDQAVFELSLSIFIVLFSSFRPLLKAEIEVIFKEVYLRILNMQTSTYSQKSLILQALMKICSNPQAIVDMYVNYDCHLGSASIFENMVDLLSKMSQGRHTKSLSNPKKGASGAFSDSSAGSDLAEERWLKLRGLRCLITVINSLVEWSKGIAKGAPAKESAPHPSLSPAPSDADGVPVVVNKNHLEHAGAVGPCGSYIDLENDGHENDDAPDKLQQSSTQKQKWKSCIAIFNRSPKKGLIELQKHGFVDDKAKSIAAFFLNSQGLSKVAIGEYLGFQDPECTQVMHAFVDQFDFEGMPFVSAIRAFLQSFRLPGEAQKIDRILEKFADRFCETNPTEFENADTAYILAFSVMMLNTDQHSSQVRDRMDLPMFIKNNRGINGGKDLPDAVLAAIFEDIVRTEIIMEEEHFGDVSGAADHQTRYRQEAAFLQKKLVSLFQGSRAAQGTGLFLSATHADHVKPMFAVAWYSIIAALSQVFEETNDSTDSETSSEAVQLCLEGFSGAIRISSLYYLETERNAFLTSLVKFTSLTQVDALRPKHVACIQALIGLGAAIGEFLDESWGLILESLSRMERLQLFSDQEAPRVSSSEARPTSRTSAAHDLATLAYLRSQPGIGERLRELRGQGSQVAVDKIFANSSQFSGVSIVHFYRALCDISLQEVNEAEGRTYCLHKIVEITYYNMRRIRLEWTPIWKILRPYFNSVGCHANHAIAALAVDSLRQLSMQFFERDELSQYHTQHEFLKPFEHIARYNPSPNMQDLVLQSISQMIAARAPRIKSGWRSLFTVLAYLAARNPSVAVLSSALNIVRDIFSKHFELLGSSFVDGVNCIVAFACNRSNQDIACEAVELLQASADPYLTLPVDVSNDDQLFLKWFPVLSGLSQVVINCRSDRVRNIALKRLFDTLRRSGELFNSDFWISVLRSVITPIFDDIRSDTSTKAQAADTWTCTMTLLIGLFEYFYAELSPCLEFVEQLFQILTGTFITHQNERLTRHSLQLFKSLIINNALRFHPAMWSSVTACLGKFFQLTTPISLFQLISEDARTYPSTPPKDIDVPEELFKCSLHLILLQTINELLDIPDLSLPSHMPPKITDRWLQLLRESMQFAQEFNRRTILRHYLWKAGYKTELPFLIKQETFAFNIYLQLAFSTYAIYGDQPFFSEVLSDCMAHLDRFALPEPSTSNSKKVDNWAHLTIQIFNLVSSVNANPSEGATITYTLLLASLPDFYLRAISCITAGRTDVCQAIQSFLQHMKQFLIIPNQPSQ
ncbi:guanine nucleotide exchange protein for ADP-robosylation factor [Entomophthora muscae]|uniref:Guanine nucleotide exchange protein for ADP-robosylation factor n=1 Tax=Entomophthora muscae TaxID=34485 RepID=A0ACC2RWZ3_9FUNG|nr:guanine nucleotide exchange protein for ADP-robosylation factor [Entomophthora muscae]